MPGNFFKKFLPAELVDKVRAAIVFRPNDRTRAAQQLPQRERTVDVERIQGYRYPAPGSRSGARVPIRETSDEVFDIKQYTRDPRNVPRDEDIVLTGTTSANLSIPEALTGSPGFKNPAVMKYDPSGLRSSMTATWGALEKAVDEKATPNHLPKPVWWNELDAIEAECERKGIPYLMGRRWGQNGTGNYNEIRW